MVWKTKSNDLAQTKKAAPHGGTAFKNKNIHQEYLKRQFAALY
jgi:hypothetical protein